MAFTFPTTLPFSSNGVFSSVHSDGMDMPSKHGLEQAKSIVNDLMLPQQSQDSIDVPVITKIERLADYCAGYNVSLASCLADHSLFHVMTNDPQKNAAFKTNLERMKESSNGALSEFSASLETELRKLSPSPKRKRVSNPWKFKLETDQELSSYRNIRDYKKLFVPESKDSIYGKPLLLNDKAGIREYVFNSENKQFEEVTSNGFNPVTVMDLIGAHPFIFPRSFLYEEPSKDGQTVVSKDLSSYFLPVNHEFLNSIISVMVDFFDSYDPILFMGSFVSEQISELVVTAARFKERGTTELAKISKKIQQLEEQDPESKMLERHKKEYSSIESIINKLSTELNVQHFSKICCYCPNEEWRQLVFQMFPQAAKVSTSNVEISQERSFGDINSMHMAHLEYKPVETQEFVGIIKPTPSVIPAHLVLSEVSFSKEEKQASRARIYNILFTKHGAPLELEEVVRLRNDMHVLLGSTNIQQDPLESIGITLKNLIVSKLNTFLDSLPLTESATAQLDTLRHRVFQTLTPVFREDETEAMFQARSLAFQSKYETVLGGEKLFENYSPEEKIKFVEIVGEHCLDDVNTYSSRLFDLDRFKEAFANYVFSTESPDQVSDLESIFTDELDSKHNRAQFLQSLDFQDPNLEPFLSSFIEENSCPVYLENTRKQHLEFLIVDHAFHSGFVYKFNEDRLRTPSREFLTVVQHGAESREYVKVESFDAHPKYSPFISVQSRASNIELKSYFLPDTVVLGDNEYALASISFGGTELGGHHTVMLRSRDGYWYFCNDNDIYQIQNKDGTPLHFNQEIDLASLLASANFINVSTSDMVDASHAGLNIYRLNGYNLATEAFYQPPLPEDIRGIVNETSSQTGGNGNDCWCIVLAKMLQGLDVDGFINHLLSLE